MEKGRYHINIFMISCIIFNLKVNPGFIPIFFSYLSEWKKTSIENPKVWNIFYLNHGLVLELEFNEFARGKWEITELEFAEMLMRYTDSWDMDEQIKEVKTRLKNQKGKLTLSTEAKLLTEKKWYFRNYFGRIQSLLFLFE